MPAYFSAFLIALLLLSPLPVRAAEPTQITVTGTGSVSLPPDEAIVSGTVETYDGHSASVAVGANAAIYDRVASSVVAVGIARSDITLSSYNVSYNPPPNDRPGYTVVRSFSVKVHQLNLAGRVIDSATSAGATAINIYFGLADTSAATTQAMERAVANATAQATALAGAARLHIVGIGSISSGGYVTAPQPRMLAAIARAPTQLDTGNTTVTQTVTIVFLAKP